MACNIIWIRHSEYLNNPTWYDTSERGAHRSMTFVHASVRKEIQLCLCACVSVFFWGFVYATSSECYVSDMAGLAPSVLCSATCPDWQKCVFLLKHWNWEAIKELHSVIDSTFLHDSDSQPGVNVPQGYWSRVQGDLDRFPFCFFTPIKTEMTLK